jgi:hypothetical protein
MKYITAATAGHTSGEPATAVETFQFRGSSGGEP